MRNVVLVLIVSTMMVAMAAAQETNSERVTVPWSDPSKPGLLKINLMSGGLTLRTHNGRDVIITARSAARNTRARAAPPESAGLRRIDSNGAMGLNIEEEKNVMTVGGSPFSGNVDLEIQVPVKTNVSAHTMNGPRGILIEGVEGEIEVTNMNGPVNLTNVSGSVVAHSMNSRVVASLRDVTPNKPMAFTSMHGNVDLTLPANLKANLKMRSDSGEIYSDFDIKLSQSKPPTVETERARNGLFRIEMSRSREGTVNGGGPEIELRTFNGHIFIRKATK